MSGFEVVGVVLGAIPLVISALEHYAEGTRTIGRLLEYKWELKKLIITLQAEEVVFQNTCEALLDGIDGLGSGEMEKLLKNPGGNLWKTGKLGERLKTRLSRSYAVIFELVSDMEDALETFKARLGLDSEGKVSSCLSYSLIVPEVVDFYKAQTPRCCPNSPFPTAAPLDRVRLLTLKSGAMDGQGKVEESLESRSSCSNYAPL
jgi:hypothetical protein